MLSCPFIKKAQSAFYDLFVDVPDQPGIIAEITQILGEADLSLTNIKILETREKSWDSSIVF